jgi:RimJ/RimL family protein N-acetyltransferase
MADGFKYAFGLADPDNFASIRGMQRVGFHLVHEGRRFYYPDAEGCFYFIDLNNSSNVEPPKNSDFWNNVLSMEPL